MQRDLAELLEFAFGAGIERQEDADGRCLGEHAAGHIPLHERRSYTFRDPRDGAGRAVNYAAHTQVLAAWPHVLAMFEGEGEGPQAMLETLRTAWAQVLSCWLSADVVPTGVSAAYKVSQGFEHFLRTWMLTQSSSAELPDERELLAMLDADGWLTGDFLVCPASRRSIAEAWCVLRGEPAESFVDGAAAHLTAQTRAWRRGLGRLEVGLLGLLACDRDDERADGPDHEVLRSWTRGPGRLGVHLQAVDGLPVPPARVTRLLPPGVDDPLCEDLSSFEGLLRGVLSDVGWSGSMTFEPGALQRLRIA